MSRSNVSVKMPINSQLVRNLNVIRQSNQNARPSQTVSRPMTAVSQSTQSTNYRTKKCKYFPKCRNGRECTFIHPHIPCKFYNSGHCNRGNSCTFLHKRICNFGDNCKFHKELKCKYYHEDYRQKKYEMYSQQSNQSVEHVESKAESQTAVKEVYNGLTFGPPPK